MIAFMVLNIIAFVLQGIGAILVGIVVAVWATVVADVTKNCIKSGFESCTCTHNGSSFTVNGVKNCDDLSSMLSIMVAIIVFLVIAAAITLAASILGCVSVCCSRVSFVKDWHLRIVQLENLFGGGGFTLLMISMCFSHACCH